MFRVHRILLLWLAALSLGGLGRAQTAVAEPSFGTGDLGLLACKVLEVRPGTEYCSLLTVEVSNGDKLAAEPLEFRIELQEKRGAPARVESFHRTSLPRLRRFGRPAAGGGRQKYVVVTSLIGKKPQYAVSVEKASWCEGGTSAPPDPLVGKPDQVQLTSLAGTFPVTRVELKNPFDRAVDALFLVTFTQPRDVVELRGMRLPAEQTTRWDLTSLAGTKTYLEQDGLPGCAMKATKFELVDWSFVGSADPAAASGLLRGAYEDWLRWPDPAPAVSGKFRYHERTQKVGAPDQYDETLCTGSFQLATDGAVSVKAESGGASHADRALTAAFKNLRREAWETVVKEHRLVAIDEARVELRGPAFGNLRTAGAQLSTGGSDESPGLHLDVEVREGRIASSGRGDEQRTVWETRELGSGYVVVHTRSESTEETMSYQQVGAWLMPEQTTSRVVYGDKLYSAKELSISELKTEGIAPAAAPLPRGAGATALRAIWNTGYRFPCAPIKTRAAFELTNPGTDLIWRGHKKLKGSFEMEGIGRNLRSLHLDFDDKLSPEAELSLVGVFRDRLLMWYGSDFGDRADFEEFFGGATIEAAGPDGSFAVANGPVSSVLTEAGLVRGWIDQDGSVRTLTWQDFDGRRAVTRIDTTCGGSSGKARDRWTETVTITLARVGEHLLPTGLQLERIFGKDWGPETLVFKGLKLY